MRKYSTPDQEITALRALLANIRSLKGWEYEDGDYLLADQVRDLIDDEADDDENIWLLSIDDGGLQSIADPTEAGATELAASSDNLRPINRVEAKILHAAARVRQSIYDEKWATERLIATAERDAARAQAISNPRFKNHDFLAD